MSFVAWAENKHRYWIDQAFKIVFFFCLVKNSTHWDWLFPTLEFCLLKISWDPGQCIKQQWNPLFGISKESKRLACICMSLFTHKGSYSGTALFVISPFPQKIKVKMPVSLVLVQQFWKFEKLLWNHLQDTWKIVKFPNIHLQQLLRTLITN